MKVLFRFKALCLLVVLLTGSMGCGGGSGSGNAASIPASTHALAVADVQQEIAASGSQWTAGETSVSQLRTDTELLAMCGLRNAGKAPAAATKFGASAVVPLPAKFTWQDKDGANWLTDVQDQGPYGTCVAFATVGSLEARIRIADSAPTKEIGLSEWHMFFLGGGDLKTGWDDDSANDFLKKTGIPDRTVCPYSQAPGHVETGSSKAFSWKVDGADRIGGRDAVKRAILAGPVIGGIEVFEDFMYYQSGVYKKVKGKDLAGHAVLLVGWDDDNDCWIARNSWGKGWGEKGFFKIKHGECDVDDIGCWAITPSPVRPQAPNHAPSTPTLIAPTANATTSTNPTLSSSAFSDADADAHDSSTWEVYDDISTASSHLVWSHAGEKTKKTSIGVSASDGLFLNALAGKTALRFTTNYYARVQYVDARGAQSGFSPLVAFTTIDGPNSPPATPSITAPTAGTTASSTNPTLASSAFADSDQGDTHGSSLWEVYDNVSLAASSLVWSSNDSGNKTSIFVHSLTGTFSNALVGKSSLSFSTNYFVRVRYVDSRGAASAFSPAVSFTTVAAPNTAPSTPSVSSPLNGATNFSVNPTISGSTFSDAENDAHASSTWELYDNASLASTTLVWSKAGDIANKISIVVNSANGTFANSLVGHSGLNFTTQYFVRVKYTDSRGATSGFSSANGFTTAAAPNNPPLRPSMTYPTSGITDASINPTLTSSAFSDPDGDTHASTTWEIYDDGGLTAIHLVWTDSGDVANRVSVAVNSTTGIFANALAGQISLDKTRTYFVRVRYTDNRGATSSFSTVAQFSTAPNAWAHTYGGTGSDIAQALAPTTDGGYVVAASTQSFGAGQNDVLVVRLRADGSVIWSRVYGGTGNEFPHTIEQTPDGGFVVGCASDSFGAGNTDIWILKLNPDGTIAFQKTYGGPANDGNIGLGVQVTADGGFIVAANTSSFGAGSDDLWVLKLDSAGTVTAQKTYGTAGQEIGYGISQTNNGGYIVGGSGSFGFGASDAWVVRLNSDLSIAWQKALGGGLSDMIFGRIRETPSGDFIVPATTTSFGPSPGTSNFWPILLDANGVVKFQEVIGGTGIDTPNAVQVDSFGNFFISGLSESFDGGVGDYWVVKLNASGSLLQHNTYGGPGQDYGRASCLASDGSLVLAGQSASFGAGGDDLWVLKLTLAGGIPNFGVASSAIVQGTPVVPVNTSVTVANTAVVGVATNCATNSVTLTVQQQAP